MDPAACTAGAAADMRAAFAELDVPEAVADCVIAWISLAVLIARVEALRRTAHFFPIEIWIPFDPFHLDLGSMAPHFAVTVKYPACS
jgi:hypothetical protein